MAEYRQIHNQIWKDSWFLELESDRKLLFIYLFSNERSALSGIYELPMAVIAFETKLPVKTIEESLRYFAACGKVAYDFETAYVWVYKLLHYNAKNTGSVRIRRHLERLMEDLSDACPYKAGWLEAHGRLIDGGSATRPQAQGPEEQGSPIHTLSIPCPQEQEQEQEKEKETNRTTTATAEATVGPSLPSPSSSSSSPAVGLFASVLGREPNRLDRETLAGMAAEQEDWRRGLSEGEAGADVDGEGWVVAAIRTANAARDPDRPFTLAFVQAILDRWRRDGFQAGWTLDEAEEEVVFTKPDFWGKGGEA